MTRCGGLPIHLTRLALGTITVGSTVAAIGWMAAVRPEGDDNPSAVQRIPDHESPRTATDIPHRQETHFIVMGRTAEGAVAVAEGMTPILAAQDTMVVIAVAEPEVRRLIFASLRQEALVRALAGTGTLVAVIDAGPDSH